MKQKRRSTIIITKLFLMALVQTILIQYEDKKENSEVEIEKLNAQNSHS